MLLPIERAAHCGRPSSISYSIMQKALDFLDTHRDVAFATVGDNHPQIRVFQIMKRRDNDLFFATSAKKEVYFQLQQNPAVELLAMEGDLSVRVKGEAHFDVDDATSQEIYNGNDILKRLYSDYRAMVYFRIPISSMDYYDLQPTPPVLEHYTL